MNIENNIGANDSTGFEVVASTWFTDSKEINNEKAGSKKQPEGVNELILPAYAINPKVLPPEMLQKLKAAHRTRLTETAIALKKAEEQKKKNEDRTI